MAYIKYTGIFSHCIMFIIYSGISDGHIISCKLSHLRAKSNMFIRKRSVLHYTIFELSANVAKIEKPCCQGLSFPY